MDVAGVATSAERPFRWSNERYLALVESGIIPEGRGIELIDGQMIEAMPQGKVHRFIFRALQRAFGSMGGFEQGMEFNSTIVLPEGNVFDPEIIFVSPDAMDSEDLATGRQVRFVVEVSVSSRATDLGSKKEAYAKSGIATYWVVDGVRRGIWEFAEPVGSRYQSERFVPLSESIHVPLLGGSIDVSQLFPAG